MILEVIVAVGFILMAFILILKFNKLSSVSETKVTELVAQLNDWKKQNEQQQESFQSQLLKQAQQTNSALQEIWKSANHDLETINKELFLSLQNTWAKTNSELRSLMEADNAHRSVLLNNVSEVQEINRDQLQEQKQQINALQHSHEDMMAKLVDFIHDTRNVAVITENYHQQMTTDLQAFSSSMHELFDTKVKQEHELILNSEQKINESLQAIVTASESNLEKYENAVKEMTAIQQSQNQLLLLIKRMQDEHHERVGTHQEEMKEGLEEIFSGSLSTLNEKLSAQNQEIELTFQEIKDEIQTMVKSFADSQKDTEATFRAFGMVLQTLDDSLKQTIQVTQTMQSEMKTLGEKDIKLLEKILR